MSVILDGEKISTPGIETISWLDDPKVPQATDGGTRTQWIRAIVLHTVKGKLGGIQPGVKPSNRAETYAKYQASTSRDVSWDYTIDTDGTVVVSNDPIKRYTWHAGSVNGFTLGIELVQEENGDIWQGQIDATVKFLDWITRELADRGHPIQRQIPITGMGTPVRGTISRIVKASEAKRVVGIYGHRNQTNNRGPGDPGDHIFNALLNAGYKGFNLEAKEDLIFWESTQRLLGMPAPDGVPGPETARTLKAAGHAHGLWITRPGD